jgi:hypothetical protein
MPMHTANPKAATQGAAAVSWKIEHEGQTYREADLTLGECEQILELVEGNSWGDVNPLSSPRHLVAVVAVCLQRSKPRAAALKEARSLPMREVLKAVTPDTLDLPEMYDDGVPPVAAGESSTSS